MNRFPVAFAQTVAFAAATGSITWQILRVLVLRGTSLGPLAIALWITAGFVAGVVVFALLVSPLQARLLARARLRGGGWSRSLLVLQVAIMAVWWLAWAIPGFRFVGLGGSNIFYGVACFLMGGALGVVAFYPRLGLGRTPV